MSAQDKYVWLVWELVKDKPTLAVICSEDNILNRYVTEDRKSWRRGGAVFVEKVMVDHLYGANDMYVMTRIFRNTK